MQDVWYVGPLPGLPEPAFAVQEARYCFKDVWDFQTARFAPCFISVIAAIPALVVILILLVQLLALLVPWRPQWTKPFVLDIVDPGKLPIIKANRRMTVWNIGLAIVTLIGFVCQLVALIQSLPKLESVFLTATWAAAALLLAIKRSRTAPYSLLLLFASIFLAQAIILSDPASESSAVWVLSTVAASVGILIVLGMPLRDPALSDEDISAPGTPPTSVLRSPEDNFTIWQFMTVSWMNPLISMGSKRQLQDEDVWSLSFEFQHRRLHDTFRELRGSVIRRLIKANTMDLVILTVLGILELIMMYATPLLLQKLLASMEDASAPARAAVTYATLNLAARLIATQSGVFSLWFGRRCYERSRGEMITMLYEKTLGRKIGFGSPPKADERDEAPTANGHADCTEAGIDKKPNFWERTRAFLAAPSQIFISADLGKDKPKQPASMGKILNLMRNDVYEVAQRFWEFQSLITKPLGVVFAIYLIWSLMGWSCFIGVLAVFSAQALNIVLAKVMMYWTRKARGATDDKLSIVSQFVEAIRHLRWYGWQDAWLAKIMSSRQKELVLLVITGCWNIAIMFVNTLAVDLFPVLAFFGYTLLSGQRLRIDIAFPAMQLFRMLTTNIRDVPGLITVVLNAIVAVGRIEDFMAEPDRDSGVRPIRDRERLALEDASFAWPGVEQEVLHEIALEFKKGLTIICGEVGSGKTALLQALLGELDQRSGSLVRPDEMVGYCAQTPWLQSMSIRENILFSTAFDKARYQQVIDACSLTEDLTSFKARDLSNIGENGIGLSGGQKARVALARAVYSRARILLLDDPLSALDQQTAERIVRRCFAGPLLEGRTIILVTHRTELCYELANQIVEITGGKATILDKSAPPPDRLQLTKSHASITENDVADAGKQQNAAVPDKFIEDEYRAHGGVQARVYWEYIKAGKLSLWIILIVILALSRVFAVGEAWFIKQWGEAYNTQSRTELFHFVEPQLNTTSWDLTGGLPSPEDNIKPWLIGFFLLALGQSLIFLLSQAIMLIIVYQAGKTLFRGIMKKVAGATFRFYDVTPVGRLMNRVTSDMRTLDGGIGNQFRIVTRQGAAWISSLVVIASVTPSFLLFSMLLTLGFVLTFRIFLPTSQSLRRLEMVSLSPLMSNFGALLDGLTTVRAFYAQHRFQDRVIAVVDTFQKMDHYYWSLQAWLMYRFDALSAASTFVLTMLALYTNVSAGLTAFVLLASNRFVSSTHELCKQYGQLQMEFVSVERVVELLHLEQEPEGSIDPPAWWPSFNSDIVFEDVTVRYAPHLDPALNNVSCTIKGGSKTAVIGRTGSGKSTLVTSILGTVTPSTGRILVDNIDLAKVNKQALRTRITFLAQDPVLFPGSLRQNLDPLEEYTEVAREAVVERACARQGWELDMHIESGGRNLSQGQRQLVGLARAVLRRSAIVILDEATASIDRETAMQIQQVLQEEMQDSTVITIAHRLEAVRNATYCIVLGDARIVDQYAAADVPDHPDPAGGSSLAQTR